jgi:hypothetical protein
LFHHIITRLLDSLSVLDCDRLTRCASSRFCEDSLKTGNPLGPPRSRQRGRVAFGGAATSFTGLHLLRGQRYAGGQRGGIGEQQGCPRHRQTCGRSSVEWQGMGERLRQRLVLGLTGVAIPADRSRI